MKLRIGKGALALLLLVALLASTPLLYGCGDSDEPGGTNEVIIGVITDFTGPAANAVKPLYTSLEDYFKWQEQEDPIPGISVKLIPFDDRTDPSRYAVGFNWLRGQGAEMIYSPAAATAESLVGRFAEAEIACSGFQGSEELPDDPWIYFQNTSVQTVAEVMLQWIIDNWDYSGGVLPKLGHQGLTYSTTIYYQEGIEKFLEMNPGKFDFVDYVVSPMGTVAWASEVKKLKDCDFVLASLIGGSLATYVKEMRLRGYEGGFISGVEGFGGFIDLVVAACKDNPELLDKIYLAAHMIWWNEDNALIDEIRDVLYQYHSTEEADKLTKTTSPQNAWANGIIMTTAIRKAAETVGPENVDGKALRDALAATDIELPGWGGPWTADADYHYFCKVVRVLKWNIPASTWDVITDWIKPQSVP
ncbi:ABC transporter substrate-binding protein [Chloroflexota bacterium]